MPNPAALLDRCRKLGLTLRVTVLILLAVQLVLVVDTDLRLRAINRQMLHGTSEKLGAVVKPVAP